MREYLDTGLTNGVIYFYVVTAVGPTGLESAFSQEVQAQPKAGCPPEIPAGTITQDTLWIRACSPYIVAGDVTIAQGATLTIEPGVEVRFKGPYSLWVQGKLMAQGTPADPITFTSRAATPAPGDWVGLRFTTPESSNPQLVYCNVRYAGGFPGTASIELFGSSPSITHCTIADGASHGIHSPFALTKVKVQDCLIARHGLDGETLLFVSNEGGDYEIWAMSLKTRERRLLTESPGLDTQPCWMGAQIVFVSSRMGELNLWRMSPGISEAVRLTAFPSKDPDWISD